ncbi:MAG: ComF family protein [Campylobacterales bacterium]|nr:ComF family protein [Campylobacterales bacterium]
MHPSQRTLSNGFKVNSFFAYDDVAELLHTKHTPHGAKVLHFLASISFTPFVQTLALEVPLLAVPVDDHVRHGYSHTAILARALKTPLITPRYGALRATSTATFSGKPLAFRKANPRGFTCKLPQGSTVILVDDLITSGQTLLEASNLLMKRGITPLFGLTLANANVT